MYSTKTVSSQTTSPWIPLDDNQAAFSATIAVAVSGTLTYSVEFTLDNVQDPAVTPVAFPIGLVGETTSNSTYLRSPVKAIRLNVTAFTSGSATIGVRQGTDNVWGYPDSTDFAEAFSTTPKAIVVSDIPFAILPGDNAANGLQFTGSAGAFSLSAAIITNGYYYLKNGFWTYLPDNFGSSSYPAGWYWATMSSDTAGVVYTDTYLSGPTVGPVTPTAFPTNLSGWLNSTTSEVVGPDGFLIPGGSLGKSGLLQSYWSLMGNATGIKSFFTLVGGTKIAQANTTTNPVSEFTTTMRNAGTAQAQINTRSPGTAPLGVGAAAAATVSSATFQFTAINTDVDKTLSVSMSISANTACAILVGYNAFATYGA